VLFIPNFEVLQMDDCSESWKSLLKKMLSAFLLHLNWLLSCSVCSQKLSTVPPQLLCVGFRNPYFGLPNRQTIYL